MEQSRIQLATAQRHEEAARQLLAGALGVSTLPPSKLREALDVTVPSFDWPVLRETVLAGSSEVQEALALVLQAEELLGKARADAVPNVQVAVRPYYAFPDRRAEFIIEAGVAVPLWNRNQGNIAAASADLARTREEVKLVKLRLSDRLAAAHQRYQAAKFQIEAYEKQIFPNARESLLLVRDGYERGDPRSNYTTVLQAQLTLAQAQLNHVHALSELWKAASEIAGLLQTRIED